MTDVYVFVIQPFEPMKFVAAFYSPNMPAAQLQNSEHHPPSVVQGLRDNLYSAIIGVKSLKDENKTLRKQISQLKQPREGMPAPGGAKRRRCCSPKGQKDCLCGQSSGGADVLHWTNQPASGTLPQIITLLHNNDLLEKKKTRSRSRW